MKRAIGAALMVLTIAACSHLGSDDADSRFVAALTSDGVPGDRGAEIQGAHQVCDALRAVADADVKTNKQPPMSLILESGQKVKDVHDRLAGLSDDQFLHFIADAGNTLCPDVKDVMNRLENTP